MRDVAVDFWVVRGSGDMLVVMMGKEWDVGCSVQGRGRVLYGCMRVHRAGFVTLLDYGVKYTGTTGRYLLSPGITHIIDLRRVMASGQALKYAVSHS